MPKLVKETTSGAQFTRSMNEGVLADSQDRVFKIILNAPNEVVNPQTACGITIGDQHPVNTEIYCKTFSVRFDGESRMVMIVTFSYESSAHSSQQPQDDKPPELRAANWATSTSLIEQPVYVWRKRHGGGFVQPGFGVDPAEVPGGWGNQEPAINPVGDIYEAVSQLTSIVNISIEQWEPSDPTRHCLYGGYINDEVMNLGSLVMQPHTVMFRGVTSQPSVESWGGGTWRGWKSTYEFAYKRNRTKIMIPGPPGGNLPGFAAPSESEVDLGWDVAVPQTGFNVKAFAPPGGADDDPYGQPLQHGDENSNDATLRQFAGRIVEPAKLFTGVAAGEKVRAMVRVFSYRGGGASQTPSASPIPLNDDGKPRKDTANPKVLVYGYQVQPSVNLTQQLGLRLE